MQSELRMWHQRDEESNFQIWTRDWKVQRAYWNHDALKRNIGINSVSLWTNLRIQTHTLSHVHTHTHIHSDMNRSTLITILTPSTCCVFKETSLFVCSAAFVCIQIRHQSLKNAPQLSRCHKHKLFGFLFSGARWLNSWILNDCYKYLNILKKLRTMTKVHKTMAGFFRLLSRPE